MDMQNTSIPQEVQQQMRIIIKTETYLWPDRLFVERPSHSRCEFETVSTGHNCTQMLMSYSISITLNSCDR